MINTMFFQFKTFGSFALRCGCSHFGVRHFGGRYPTQIVFIFKNYQKMMNYSGWLRSFLNYTEDFYYKEVYKNGQMLHLVFVNCALHIKGAKSKLYFKTFRSFCKAELTVYNKYILHPNQSNSFQRLVRVRNYESL